MNNRQAKIDALSIEFAARIRAELTETELTEAVRMNDTPLYVASEHCATDEFCESSDIMLAAWKSVFKKEHNMDDPGERSVLKEACELAKSRRYQ